MLYIQYTYMFQTKVFHFGIFFDRFKDFKKLEIKYTGIHVNVT